MSAKDNRQVCWQARDFYLACLNSTINPEDFYSAIKAHSSTVTGDNDACTQIVPVELRSEECNRLRTEMYSKCPESWADHFEKKFRGYKLKEYQMKKLKEIGAQPL